MCQCLHTSIYRGYIAKGVALNLEVDGTSHSGSGSSTVTRRKICFVSFSFEQVYQQRYAPHNSLLICINMCWNLKPFIQPVPLLKCHGFNSSSFLNKALTSLLDYQAWLKKASARVIDCPIQQSTRHCWTRCISRLSGPKRDTTL